MNSKNVVAARIKRQGLLVIVCALVANGGNMKIELSLGSNHAQAAPEVVASVPVARTTPEAHHGCPILNETRPEKSGSAARKCGCAAARDVNE